MRRENESRELKSWVTGFINLLNHMTLQFELFKDLCLPKITVRITLQPSCNFCQCRVRLTSSHDSRMFPIISNDPDGQHLALHPQLHSLEDEKTNENMLHTILN